MDPPPAKARPDYGLALGAVAWATSYAVLAKAKLYKPMWEYDSRPLAKDLGAQTVFGTGPARAVRGRAKLRAASGRVG